jgi:peptidoglycan hydrolase-like protein with peptidoglycan-binding domain
MLHLYSTSFYPAKEDNTSCWVIVTSHQRMQLFDKNKGNTVIKIPSTRFVNKGIILAEFIAAPHNTATRKRRKPMAESARDRYAEMLSQGYDAGVIRQAPDVEPGAEDPSLVEVQNFLKRYGYLDYEPVAQGETPEAGRLDEVTVRALTEFQRRYNVGTPGTLDGPTRELMAAPGCGMPDLVARPSPFFATACAWNRRNLTYAFGNLSGDVANNVAQDAVRRAFNTWAGAGVGLSFTEVAQNANPDIFVEWRQAADPDASMVGNVLAHADYPPGCTVVVNPPNGTPPQPIHFDDQEHTWADGAAANSFDIETVALHEIGHCLGLDHSDVSGSVMWRTVAANTTLRTLQSDDLAGIQALYPSGPWAGWGNLGGVLPGMAAVGQNADGRLEAFHRGTDNVLYQRWQTAPNNGWSSDWTPLGSIQISGDPVVASNADGRLEVFVRGTDNALWHIWQTAPNNGWSNWESLGGILNGDPVVARNADGRLEAFHRGTDNVLYTRWQTAPNNGWSSGWDSLGGVLPGRAAVGQNADGRLEAFHRGTDNVLYTRWQTAPNNGWAPSWESLGGVLNGDPVVARNADGRLEVFVRGDDNALRNRWQTAPNNGWS